MDRSFQPNEASFPFDQDRYETLAFIKILFLFLKANGEESRLSQAKAIVWECTYQFKADRINYSQLNKILEGRLRNIVGDEYLLRTKKYLHAYKHRRGQGYLVHRHVATV